MSKEIKFGEDARKSLLNGVDSQIRTMTCILHVYRAPNDKDFELYCHRNNHQLIVLLFCDFSYTKSTLRYLVWRI